MARVGSAVLREQLQKGANPEIWVRFPRLLGDVVFALPFFGSLQRAWNPVAADLGVKLRWITVGHASGAALFSEADPDFVAENLIESGGRGKPDPWQMQRRWRERRPLAVINLSQSVRLALGAWMNRVPIRAGDVNNHLGFLYHYRFTYRDLPIPIVERFRPLLGALTGTDDLLAQAISPELFGGLKGPAMLAAAGWNGGPYVTLGFGTRGHPKRWFPEARTWPELARLLQARGLQVVWLGGSDDRDLARQFAEAVPGSFDLCGQTTIPEACALQYGAAGNIALDTGLAHTAAATGRPTVMINGISPESLIHPLGPAALTVRGPFLDGPGQPRADFETFGSSAHRIPPGRVVNLLEALMRETSPAKSGMMPASMPS